MATYIAMDWAQSTFAIAWQSEMQKMEVFESTGGILVVKEFLLKIEDEKFLTLEEGTSAQWLYTELKPYVDELLVCNPRRNALLSEGAKTDKIDAIKLLQLYRAGLLKPVFHTFHKNIELRKLVSAYNDFVRAAVRLKNQKSAVLRSVGKAKNSNLDESFDVENLVIKKLQEQIELVSRHQNDIKEIFSKYRRKNEAIRLLESIPGIGEVNSVRILAAVVDAKRFENKSKFLSYCGLVKHERSSGGKISSYKSYYYNRGLKLAFKTATLVCIQEGKDNYFNKYYQWKLSEGLPPHDARNATARKIATVALGVLRTNRKFNDKNLKTFAA